MRGQVGRGTAVRAADGPANQALSSVCNHGPESLPLPEGLWLCTEGRGAFFFQLLSSN